MIAEILRATPIWVFVLFAYLMWAGLCRLRTQVRRMRSLWIAPVLFVLWGLYGLLGRAGPLPLTLACWVAGAVLGAMIGRWIEPLPSSEGTPGLVRQRGSAIPLLRNLLVFGAHYLLHVAAAFATASAAARLMSWDTVVSGLGAGYFLGWGLLLAHSLRASSSPSAAHPVPVRSSP